MSHGARRRTSHSGGIHTCIGAPLARLELAVALKQLVQTVPGLTLAEQPTRKPPFLIRGYESVMVLGSSN